MHWLRKKNPYPANKPLETKQSLVKIFGLVSDSQIPDEIRKFLVQHVRSIAQLDILLLISAAPQRWWTATEVYRIVLSNEELVAKTLERFCQINFLRKSESGTYQFAPPSDEINNLIKTLALLYRERPSRIVQAIYEAPVSEIEEFAKAFKIRKKP